MKVEEWRRIIRGARHDSDGVAARLLDEIAKAPNATQQHDEIANALLAMFSEGCELTRATINRHLEEMKR